MWREAIGWGASAILVLTIFAQISRQWRARSSKGVSRWLFIGQIAASAGFTLYSLLVHNYVFIVTNAILLLSAVVGLAIVVRDRHCDSDQRQS